MRYAGLLLALLAACPALAQNRQPASMTVQPTVSPEPLDVLDAMGRWNRIGQMQNGVFQGVSGGTPPGTVAATDVGMRPDGITDNSQYQNAFMQAVMNPANGGMWQTFPAVVGQQYASYFFSKPFRISRAGAWDCGGFSPPGVALPAAGTTGGSALVFPAGVSGVRLEGPSTAPADDAGGSATGATLQNCAIRSLGFGFVNNAFTAGQTTITGVAMQGVGTPAQAAQPGYVAPSTWSGPDASKGLPGDGFVLWGAGNAAYTIVQDTLTNGSWAGTGHVTSGVFTLATTSLGTFPLGGPIMTSIQGGMIEPYIGPVYASKLLSGTQGAPGSTYQVYPPNVPDFPIDYQSNPREVALGSAYATLVVPPTVLTNAKASFGSGVTSIDVTAGTCGPNTPAGVDVYDTDKPARLGTLQYCVPKAGKDTIYLAAGSLSASKASTDQIKTWSVTVGQIGTRTDASLPMGPETLWSALDPATRIFNSAIDTHVTAETNITESGGAPGGGGTYTLSAGQYQVSAAASQGLNLQYGPASPPGSYIDSVSTDQTQLTIHADTITPGQDYRPTIGSQGAPGAIYQLPATQAYTINSNSPAPNQFTVTAGPYADPNRLLQSGDFVVSDAYPYGCVVDSYTGGAGAQVVTLRPAAYFNNSSPVMTNCQNTQAAASHRLWVLPACVRNVMTATLRSNACVGFPIGFNEYSNNTVQGGTTSGSLFVNTTATYGMIGYHEAGSGASPSTYQKNSAIHNKYSDFIMAGQLGSNHYGDQGLSTDGFQNVLAYCNGSNLGVWDAPNFSNASFSVPWCLPATGKAFSLSYWSNSYASQGWIFNPPSWYPIYAPVFSRNGFAQTQLQFAPTSGAPGVYFDTRGPQGTANPFQMYYTTAGNAGLIVDSLTMSYNPSYDNWQTGMSGNQGYLNAADVWGAGPQWIPSGGYAAGGASAAQGRVHGFPMGFTIGGASATGPGGERLIDAGTSAITNSSSQPTATQAFLATSQIIAISSITGVAAGRTATDTTIGPEQILGTVSAANTTQNWLTLAGAATHTSSGQNDTLLFDGSNPISASDYYGAPMTMIPVPSCTGVSNGQAVTDLTDGGATAPVGTVSACGPGQPTMALANTGGAGHAGTAGDTIAIALRRHGDCRLNLLLVPGGSSEWCVPDNAGSVVPAGLVAAESSGKAWPSASAQTTIASLPACPGSPPTTPNIKGASAVITNGVAAPAYLSAVSTTGTSVRRVFCDATGWLYD